MTLTRLQVHFLLPEPQGRVSGCRGLLLFGRWSGQQLVVWEQPADGPAEGEGTRRGVADAGQRSWITSPLDQPYSFNCLIDRAQPKRISPQIEDKGVIFHNNGGFGWRKLKIIRALKLSHVWREGVCINYNFTYDRCTNSLFKQNYESLVNAKLYVTA